MAFIAVSYMFINQFAIQHIVDRPGEYITSYAHQSLKLDLFRILTLYLCSAMGILVIPTLHLSR